MQITLQARGTTPARQVDLHLVAIPDLWPVAQRAKSSHPADYEDILECWWTAHDLNGRCWISRRN